MPALCSRFGIEVGNTGERVGTFAIAYAAHKALSPVWHVYVSCITSMCLHHWDVYPGVPWMADARANLYHRPLSRFDSHRRWHSPQSWPGYLARREATRSSLEHEVVVAEEPSKQCLCCLLRVANSFLVM